MFHLNGYKYYMFIKPACKSIKANKSLDSLDCIQESGMYQWQFPLEGKTGQVTLPYPNVLFGTYTVYHCIFDGENDCVLPTRRHSCDSRIEGALGCKMLRNKLDFDNPLCLVCC